MILILVVICVCMQQLLLCVDSIHDILNTTRAQHGFDAVGADDMLPLFIHIILLSVILILYMYSI